ncbi:MAG: prepilin-type N-terminal cleavage/methylation domain-containing protein [Candidatus Omnitrophota bacterium]
MKGRGFTLVEIMIVTAIIGIVAAVVVFNTTKAAEIAQSKTCIANLRQLYGAKMMWAADNGKISGDVCIMSDIVSDYLKSTPSCPSGGNYTIGNVGTTPACSLESGDDHKVF